MHDISAESLHNLLTTNEEFALIDVREQAVFGLSHILMACCLPLSHLELISQRALPFQDVKVVICDAGDAGKETLARRAGQRLSELGYSNVSILQGGIDAWHARGYELYSGVNVPSKAFGEFVEHEDSTPRITAQTLNQWQSEGKNPCILDSRPFDEFNRMSIPGGVDAPGAELVFRVNTMVKDTTTPVVVNCAGRTRSIIGCQSLINAGLENPVYALKDGTMGWHLAGLTLAHEETACAPRPQGEALNKARARASAVAKRYNIAHVSIDGLKQRIEQLQNQTHYLVDVRSPDEFIAGHWPGSFNTPGGQLVQATDESLMVRNAAVTLIDDEGVRATMTASWLAQMGWPDVTIATDIREAKDLQTGAWIAQPPARDKWPEVSAHELRAVLDSKEPVAVLDLADSLTFKNGHIKDAWWALRSRLATDLQFKPAVGMLILTSPDGVLAEYAAQEVQSLRHDTIIHVLKGGTQAWQQAGFALSDDAANPAGPGKQPNDVFYKPYDHGESIEDRMQQYLDWEVALVEQIKRDATVNFKRFS